ncbi:MerR family transcriptional regulator [Clostridium sp. AM58-1XD]|uniref:MerR family transcriptional regulator n=1 Tax=Clostridium sp. AM58-1XD TaxID=2292307 RepID=UPI000E4EF6A2|nr:MerR family transcriptional regulator [Clostridium sp. AM58-1XD]RGY95637.1 MerR family transcriptional regulator [Clostridium sp. AM58-1XD]
MFSIGEFSRICQVSIKTLRYYDKIGLMEPERVDRFTGYRYYSQAQMEKMLLIQRMKRYGFSLEEIREVLMCSEKRVLFSKLLQQRERLKQQQRETSVIISELSAHLDNFERTGDIMGYQKGYEIQVKEDTDKAVLSSRQNMGVEEFGKYYGSIYERLPKTGATPDGIVGAVYHDEEFCAECSDIELIVGIREKEKADRILKGGLCAVTIHRGTYSSLPDAYGAIVSWMENSGYVMAAPPYEIYLKNQFDGLPPEKWETEIYFPIKKK